MLYLQFRQFSVWPSISPRWSCRYHKWDDQHSDPPPPHKDHPHPDIDPPPLPQRNHHPNDFQTGFLSDRGTPVYKIPLHQVPLPFRPRNKQSSILRVSLEVGQWSPSTSENSTLIVNSSSVPSKPFSMLLLQPRSANLGGEMADFLTEGDLKPTTRWIIFYIIFNHNDDINHSCI